MAIAATTPVPTPSGWVLASQLRPGDHVFRPRGGLQAVGSVQSYIPSECYRVSFDDGIEIVGDRHMSFALQDKIWRDKQGNWFRNQSSKYAKKRFRRPLRVKTASQLAAGPLADHRRRKIWSLQTVSPLEYPTMDLPVPPYILGLWLGTMAKSGKNFATGLDFNQVQKTARQFGFTLAKTNYHGRRELQFRPSVRESFTYARAEIPSEIPGYYLESSVESREWLLKGLIDAKSFKQSETWPNQMRGFDSWTAIRRKQQLLEGLGHRTKLTKKEYETNYELMYTKKPKNITTLRRYISKIEKIEPVQCVHIAVEGEFVAGEGFLAVC